jgi:adenine deaminase
MRQRRKPSLKELKQRIDAAMGRRPVDLLLKGGTLVDVFSGTLRKEDVAIHDGVIVGFGDYETSRIIDVSDRYVSPGFIDGHVHMESSMVTPPEYARVTISRGTTTVVIDPHEIANVFGMRGIEWIIRSAARNPLNVFVMLPSCVPATSLETSGASLSGSEIEALIDKPWVLGIGEMMNFPGVLAGAPSVLRKLTAAHGKRIDGHAPGLSGKSLSAYLSARIASDHECMTLREAEEKLEAGMFIMIREGSSAKNLTELIPLATWKNSRRLMFVSDDCHPHHLIHTGHMDGILRKAVQSGLDPVMAVQMVTLNPAAYFGLHDMGAVAPGFRADLVVLRDLESFCVDRVICGGAVVVEKGTVQESAFLFQSPSLPNSVHVPTIRGEDLRVRAKTSRVNIIGVVPGQVATRASVETIPIEDGCALPALQGDILKIVVVERHHRTGRIGRGFVRGFGLKEGAIGSSVAHDSHNIVVVGTNDGDMALAVNQIAAMKGGVVATSHGRVRGALPLPLAGLLSDQSAFEVDQKLGELQEEVRLMGSALESPFMTLSFLALPVIPHLKITDRGLVDVDAFQIIDLFV